MQQKCTRLGRRARLKYSSRGVEFASRTKSYAIESKTTAKRGISRVSSVLKISAKSARTRGRLFYFTFEAFFYKFARLVSRTSANVMMRIDRVVFFALPEWRRRRRISFFFPSAQSVVEATEFFFMNSFFHFHREREQQHNRRQPHFCACTFCAFKKKKKKRRRVITPFIMSSFSFSSSHSSSRNQQQPQQQRAMPVSTLSFSTAFSGRISQQNQTLHKHFRFRRRRRKRRRRKEEK